MPHTTTILASLCALAAIVTLTQTCTPEMSKDEMTLEYKTMRSDVLVYGLPRTKRRDTRFPNQEIYIVDFEVRCIFKGGPLPEVIKVYHVGKKDPMCSKTKLEINKRMLLFLKKSGKHFVPTYKEGPGNEQFLEEIPVLCGITVRYPIGYSHKMNKEKCVEEWNDPDCVPLPTMAPGTEEEGTEPPVGEDDDEASYESVKTGNGGDGSSIDGNKNKGSNKEVKIGDRARKDGKASENMEQTTTPGGRAGDNKSSLIMSLGALLVCLFVLFKLN